MEAGEPRLGLGAIGEVVEVPQLAAQRADGALDLERTGSGPLGSPR
ncbi:hypothetical protein [Sorangium sp. So ce233]